MDQLSRTYDYCHIPIYYIKGFLFIFKMMRKFYNNDKSWSKNLKLYRRKKVHQLKLRIMAKSIRWYLAEVYK